MADIQTQVIKQIEKIMGNDYGELVKCMEKINLSEEGENGIDELVKKIGEIECNEEGEKVDEPRKAEVATNTVGRKVIKWSEEQKKLLELSEPKAPEVLEEGNEVDTKKEPDKDDDGSFYLLVNEVNQSTKEEDLRKKYNRYIFKINRFIDKFNKKKKKRTPFKKNYQN